MRKMKHTLTLAATALLLAACTQDELAEQGNALPEGEYPLELTANLYEAVATPASASTRSTIDGVWDANTKIAVRVNNSMVKEYIATPNATAGSATLACPDLPEGDTDFWWTGNGQTKAVDAWCPYRVTCPTDWSVSLDQSPATMAAEGLMYATSKNFTLANQKTQALEFKHMLAKVTINLRSSSYLTAANEVKVTLTGQYKTGELRLNSSNTYAYIDGKSNWDNTITPYKLPSAGDGNYASYQALVIPLDAAAAQDAQICIEVDGTKYGYSLKTIGSTFISGYAYTYNITVKEEGLEVSTGVSIGWNMGTGGTGEVTL